MLYHSTNNPGLKFSLKEAVFKGLAPDKGLFMPERFVPLDQEFIKNLPSCSVEEIAYQVSNAFFGDDIGKNELMSITLNAVNFPLPLVHIHDNIYTLELFHGPTLAFKDVGARFMARMLEYFTRDFDREIHVLVATSGDTGSAVANGFLGVSGIKVHILYPKGMVSSIQEKQFTTLDRNISALEVEGTFDDCQKLVKEAFNDKSINNRITLTSANSINLARLLPQSIYYFIAVKELGKVPGEISMCVPSGNFGNLTAGLIGKRIGLPVQKFVAATNINDVVPEYLETGKYRPRPSLQTIANAMDVGDPSNFTRILELYGKSCEKISEDLEAYSYRDEQLKSAIRTVSGEYGYLMDPHGAAGYLGIRDYLDRHPSSTGIFFETAHPAKFADIVEEITGQAVEIPSRLQEFFSGTKNTIPMTRVYKDFKAYLEGLINN